MCLVFSLLLSVLSINFYLNGFIFQAVICMLAAMIAFFIMGQNIKCGLNGCEIKTEEGKNDN